MTLHNNYRGFRSNFEAIRKLFGYTQSALASKLGTTQNYLTLIETGRAKSAPMLNKVSQYFQINPAFLSGDSPAPDNYIFLKTFYAFTLKATDFSPYIFLLKCLSGFSSFIEIVYIFSDVPSSSNSRSGSYPRPLEGVGVKDDRGTIFFFRDPDGRKLDPAILNVTPPSISPIVDYGRSLFTSELVLSPNIIERRINASTELSRKINNGATTLSDISNVFFSPEHFKSLADAHSKMAGGDR